MNKKKLKKEIEKERDKLDKLMAKEPILDEEHKDYLELRQILYTYVDNITGYGDDTGFVYFEGLDNQELFDLVKGVIKLIKHITYGEFEKIEA